MPPSRTRDAKVPCPHPGCQSIFLARDLPRHLRTHLSPEQRRAYEYECKACGHRSLQKVNVVQHIISKHVNDRFHECLYPGEPACNLTFTTSSIRTKHRNDAHPPDTEYPGWQSVLYLTLILLVIGDIIFVLVLVLVHILVLALAVLVFLVDIVLLVLLVLHFLLVLFLSSSCASLGTGSSCGAC
ncbi:hypothetical protein K466DRAFT_603871 [Polyporus arcularius HHB13444]|uniref:C2H2-type domain-containing protein n=1 Tax=Polyporus arcularius HHB13444 TaxID=1314778 RepID=A0A5C3NXR4_9APHY|nr:hypothetical protein K466DRAFT_603871 [Polyporus arcularius HHB13444]